MRLNLAMRYYDQCLYDQGLLTRFCTRVSLTTVALHVFELVNHSNVFLLNSSLIPKTFSLANHELLFYRRRNSLVSLKLDLHI